MITVGILNGCEKCGRPNLPDYFYCKKCLLNYCGKQLEDVRNADYLEDNFKLQLATKYQRKIKELENA